MTPLFRTQLVLMLFDLFAYGQHVRDERAFAMRLGKARWG